MKSKNRKLCFGKGIKFNWIAVLIAECQVTIQLFTENRDLKRKAGIQ